MLHFLVCLHQNVKGFHYLSHEPISIQETSTNTEKKIFAHSAFRLSKDTNSHFMKRYSQGTFFPQVLFLNMVFLYLWICTSPKNDARLANVFW